MHVRIPLIVESSTALVRTALVRGHTQGGIDPCGVTEEEYINLDAHKPYGQTQSHQTTLYSILMSVGVRSGMITVTNDELSRNARKSSEKLGCDASPRGHISPTIKRKRMLHLQRRGIVEVGTGLVTSWGL